MTSPLVVDCQWLLSGVESADFYPSPQPSEAANEEEELGRWLYDPSPTSRNDANDCC